MTIPVSLFSLFVFFTTKRTLAEETVEMMMSKRFLLTLAQSFWSSVAM